MDAKRRTGPAPRDAIKNFETFRTLCRIIFLEPGGRTKQELCNLLALSPRQLDYYRRIIRERFPEDALRDFRAGADAFRSDMFEARRNSLAETYRLKAFGREDVPAALLYLQVLGNANGPLPLREIVNSAYAEEPQTDERTQRRPLEVLSAQGWVQSAKHGRARLYGLRDDILAGLSRETLVRLAEATDLLKDVLLPTTAGYYLNETLHDRLAETSKPEESLFMIRDAFFHRVLDDRVLCTLLDAMTRKYAVSFVNRGEKERREGYTPLKIISERIYGRSYLLARREGAATSGQPPEEEAPELFRLDRISEPKPCNPPTEESDAENKLCAVSPRRGNHDAENVFLRHIAHSLFGIDTDSGAVYRIILSARNAAALNEIKVTFPKAEELAVCPPPSSEERMRAAVLSRSPNELKPWLRQRIDRIAVEDDGGSDLKAEMDSELAEWRRLYGIIS